MTSFNSRTIRLSLFALALGGFGIGLTEFVVMGLLPDIAQSLGVSIPTAGHMISAYALGVVVGAPVLVLFVGRFSPKKILLALMVMFTVFNGLSSLSSSFNVLLLMRFLSGLPHGAFFGVGAVVASRLVGKGKEASAIAIMFGDLTVCNIVGVPIGTFVGHLLSWRAAFALVVLIGLLTLMAIAMWMPALPGADRRPVAHEFRIFKNEGLWFAIFIASIGFGGMFAWYSYIAPLLPCSRVARAGHPRWFPGSCHLRASA